ncbi:MAG: hypothetical protein NVS3B25_31600 [Hymenobacter sp.]
MPRVTLGGRSEEVCDAGREHRPESALAGDDVGAYERADQTDSEADSDQIAPAVALLSASITTATMNAAYDAARRAQIVRGIALTCSARTARR